MSQRTPRESNSRLGLLLFSVYTIFYVGFVLVCAFAAEWSERIVLAGLNLAVVWGFALIGLAFVLALVYGFGCKTDNAPESPSAEDRA